mmetsp:Transcript_3548/g.5640  ORF Transcript_3548/g.5640 Transcript_3548/m.5640 type:complete len:116 (-) Transcript_3548:1441-1788(-)
MLLIDCSDPFTECNDRRYGITITWRCQSEISKSIVQPRHQSGDSAFKLGVLTEALGYVPLIALALPATSSLIFVSAPEGQHFRHNPDLEFQILHYIQPHTEIFVRGSIKPGWGMP